MSFLQKSSSSPITCHATGFYPHKAKLLWRKDGKELDEGVNRGEILPNNDGTLQISADLDLSSVKPEDWRSYDCVFQLCGVNKDIITRLDRAVIRTNEGQSALRSDEGQKHHLVYCNIIVHSKEQFMQFYVLKDFVSLFHT